MEGIEEDSFVTAEVSDRLQLWAENTIDIEKRTLYFVWSSCSLERIMEAKATLA